MADEEYVSLHFNGDKFVKPISIYLAGPLTCNDPRTNALCDEVRKVIREVLTAADPACRVYDPAEVTKPGTPHTPQDVFKLDYEATVGADLVFFHIPAASIGVGMEAMISASATVPKALAFPAELPISRMFDGLFNPTVARIKYDGIDDLKQSLEQSAPELLSAALASRDAREGPLDRLRGLGFGKLLYRQRIRVGLSRVEVANQTCVQPDWLKKIEVEDGAAAGVTLIQLMRITDALAINFDAQAYPLHLKWSVDDTHDDEAEGSLDNLVEFCRSRRADVEDGRILEMWRSYCPGPGETVLVRRGGLISVDQWASEYDGYDDQEQLSLDFD